MHDIVLNSIVAAIQQNKGLIRIAVRQRAKFEGWLKFELAYQLEKGDFGPVAVESQLEGRAGRSDITFMHLGKRISIELKTSNTNWRMSGVESNTRPITKNIDSIIADAVKHNSDSCVIAFVLFPIPSGELGWRAYIDRIVSTAGVEINREANCKLIEVDVDDTNKCDMLVCSFLSKKVERILQA